MVSRRKQATGQQQQQQQQQQSPKCIVIVVTVVITSPVILINITIINDTHGKRQDCHLAVANTTTAWTTPIELQLSPGWLQSEGWQSGDMGTDL